MEPRIRLSPTLFVTIGTPNHHHFTIAYDAIKHRKPFALEKPVSLDTREAEFLKDLLRDDNLPMICFSYRYKAAVRYDKRLIGQGELGSIRHVYSQYLQSWAIPEQLPLVWRFQKAFSGSGALGDLGDLGDLGSHILDMKSFLVGMFSVFLRTLMITVMSWPDWRAASRLP